MKQDLRLLGRIALLAIAALVAAPIIFFLLVATLVWFAYLAFAPKPD